MKRITWKKHHKWFGIIFAFFMLMFCLSGIVLNHREMVADINVDRNLLPDAYRYEKWNMGLLRGAVKYKGNEVLIYGNSGIWKTDSAGMSVTDFNLGLPNGADFRKINALAMTPDSSLFAAGQFALYRMDGEGWESTPLALSDHERISDLILKDDTLVVVGRSFLYTSVSPYKEFHRLQIKAPAGYDGKVSLFRTLWLMHSGEMFGTVGKLIMDAVAVILVMLCLTGLAYWLLPKYIRRMRKNGKTASGSIQLMKSSLNWHDKLGRYTFVVLMFVAFTGWCLRPPVLIALVSFRTPTIPYTTAHSENAWNDRLRMLRYDAEYGDWLLSSSEGIYFLATLRSVPVKLDKTPPVSVMGLNVWQKDTCGNWLAGSFSGMYVWDRSRQVSTDYFTGETAENVSGPPFGKYAVSGYCDNIGDKPFVVEYHRGTMAVPMPENLSSLPMSLWNFAQEIHTGRIYTILGQGTLVYIFFAGLAALWCLYSGFVIRRKKRNGK